MPAQTPAAAVAPPANAPHAQEVGRLAELRSALWSAFEVGTVPSGLIDLTMAYTAALRLELSLTSWPKPASARSSATGPPLRGRL